MNSHVCFGRWFSWQDSAKGEITAFLAMSCRETGMKEVGGGMKGFENADSHVEKAGTAWQVLPLWEFMARKQGFVGGWPLFRGSFRNGIK